MEANPAARFATSTHPDNAARLLKDGFILAVGLAVQVTVEETTTVEQTLLSLGMSGLGVGAIYFAKMGEECYGLGVIDSTIWCGK